MHHPSLPASDGELPTTETAPDRALTEFYDKIEAINTQLQQDGWDTTVTRAPQTNVLCRADPDQLWLSHETRPNQPTAVVASFQDGTFISSSIYKNKTDGWLLKLPILLNPNTAQAILLPTILTPTQRTTLISDTTTHTTLYSVITRPTGDQIGQLKHPTIDSLLPELTHD